MYLELFKYKLWRNDIRSCVCYRRRDYILQFKVISVKHSFRKVQRVDGKLNLVYEVKRTYTNILVNFIEVHDVYIPKIGLDERRGRLRITSNDKVLEVV